MKKLLIATLVWCTSLWLTFAQDSNQDVVSWLYSNWLTKYSSASSFRPYDSITRGEAAKFMVEYAQMQKMTKVKSAQECQFSDIANYDSTLRPYIIQACEYGIFKWSNGRYFPNNNITKWEAIAVVMRTRYGALDENIYPWYLPYYNKAKNINLSLWNIGIFNNVVNRIDIGGRLKVVNGVVSDTIPQRDGDSKAYDITTLTQILGGNRSGCYRDPHDNNLAWYDRTYYCSEQEETNNQTTKYTNFLNALQNRQYQDAANMMNQARVIPAGGGLNTAVYYIPYTNGILWFHISWNGDTEYNLSYITIRNNSLYINWSKHSFYPWWDNASDSMTISWTSWNTYSPKAIQSCKIANPDIVTGDIFTPKYIHNIECINKHLQWVLLNNITDPDTKSRIDAMKQKIDQWYQ